MQSNVNLELPQAGVPCGVPCALEVRAALPSRSGLSGNKCPFCDLLGAAAFCRFVLIEGFDVTNGFRVGLRCWPAF